MQNKLKELKTKWVGSFLHCFMFCALGNINVFNFLMVFMYHTVTIPLSASISRLSLLFVPVAIATYALFNLVLYIWAFLVFGVVVRRKLSFLEYWQFKMNTLYGAFHIYGYLHLILWIFPVQMSLHDFLAYPVTSVISGLLLVYEWWLIMALANTAAVESKNNKQK